MIWRLLNRRAGLAYALAVLIWGLRRLRRRAAILDKAGRREGGGDHITKSVAVRVADADLARPARDAAHVVESASGGCDGAGAGGRTKAKVLSAKFAGLRRALPTDPMPNLEAFAPDVSHQENWPEAWDSMLERSADEETGCDNLRADLTDVPGPKDPITLLRYLRARKGDVAKASAMFRETMQWREETGHVRAFREGSADDDLHRRLDPYYPVNGLIGCDLDGDPLIMERLAQTDPATVNQIPIDFLIKHEIYKNVRFQQAIDEHSRAEGRPRMYLTVIEDLNGLGMQHLNMTAVKRFGKTVRVSEDHFPEMLKRCIIVRAPWIFSKIWAIVQKFFDEGTRDKIQVVAAADTFQVLSKYVDPAWIPEELGGSHRIGASSPCETLVPCGGPVPETLLHELAVAYS